MSTDSTASKQRLDWDEAEMHAKTAGGFILVIRGVAPVPMEVELEPRPVGTAPDEYRGIAVVGTPRDDVVPQVETPWGIQVDPAELPKGTRGFVLVGATKREYFPPQED